jgi:hypothetical protein
MSAMADKSMEWSPHPRNAFWPENAKGMLGTPLNISMRRIKNFNAYTNVVSFLPPPPC